MKIKMVQLADLFSVPEIGLLCNVAEYFERNHIDYHPEILFRDVKVNLFTLTMIKLVFVATFHCNIIESKCTVINKLM